MDLATSMGIAGVSAVAAALTFVAVDGPVSRPRLERFADRHGLTVTAGNGGQIIAYLAITRRWRAAGLTAGATAYTLIGLTEQRLGLSVLHMLAGWFVGALIAEVRVAAIKADKPKARLVRRTADRYLPTSPLWRLGTLAVWPVVVWVLRRPQPAAEPDVLAADDAIRSRSLHVLVASAVTLLLYLALAAVPPVLALIFAVLVPLNGWRMATARWIVPQPEPVSAATQSR
jgi:hypothetical protein